MHNSWYVLTGGPGSGKTTTLAELERRGHKIVTEVARRMFEEKIARGESIEDIRMHIEEFEHLILDEQARVESQLSHDEAIFFDRAMPDQIAYYRFFNVPEDEHLRRALDGASYRKVFLLDLVKVEEDDVRKESAAESAMLHEYTREGYEREGYDIVRVPVLGVGERVDFILSNL